MNILDCIAQIEKCDFECDGGPLRNNVGYIELKARIAELEAENQRLRAAARDAVLEWREVIRGDFDGVTGGNTDDVTERLGALLGGGE